MPDIVENQSHRSVALNGGSRRITGLILNADDWGQTREVSNKILECFDAGVMSSTSAMVFMEDSERAAEIAVDRNLDAGLHLNLDTPFSLPAASPKLLEHLERLAGFLKHSFSRPIFRPDLARSFEYLVLSQLDEYRRLYGRSPSRIDGHHHMHLCANVLLTGYLPQGMTVRRHFSYEPGEKLVRNGLFRIYSRILLICRYQTPAALFSLPPLQPQRLKRIFGLGSDHLVEIETHPVNADEFRFLVHGDIVPYLESARILPRYSWRIMRSEAK